MTICYFCEEECDEDRDEFSESVDCFLHRSCLARALRERAAYDKTLHRLAREFDMWRAAPGRRAIQCPAGHAFKEPNIGRSGKTGSQTCRACRRERHRLGDREKQRAYRRKSGKLLVIAAPGLAPRVMSAAAAVGVPVSRFIRDLLYSRLPEWERRLGCSGGRPRKKTA